MPRGLRHVDGRRTLFATTYARSKSTLQCAIEHSLWGDFVFTVGLGWYFYSGSVGAA